MSFLSNFTTFRPEKLHFRKGFFYQTDTSAEYLGVTVSVTARKTIFPKSWNIMESSERPGKYHLFINFFGSRKDRIFHLQKVQNKNF